MAVFEIEAGGKVYEIDAPDEARALAAVQGLGAGGAAAPDASAQDAREAAAGRVRAGVMRKAQNMPGDEIRRMGGAIDAGARLAANGLTFGLADKFAGAGDALIGRAASYDEGVKAQRGQTQAIRDANPVPAAAAEMAGGLVGGVGLIKNGATLAGRVGPSLLARVLGYGAEGAGYGAAHGAGNTYSDRPADYVDAAKKGAAAGGAIGMALPVAGAVAGGAYRMGSAFLGPQVEGASRGASAMLRGAAQADEAGLRNLPQMGPEAMMVDAGPAMLGLGQGAATGTGPGRSRLVEALASRDARTGDRLAGTLDDALGPAPVPSRVEAGLAASRETVGEAYQPLMQGAAPVDISRLARGIETQATNLRGPEQRALRQVREMLGDVTSGGGTSPQVLLSTRQSIDGLIAGETNPQVVRQLTIARQAIDEELAAAVPGIKQVDARFQELSRQSEGLRRGGQVFDSGKEAVRPVELTEELAQGALPQGQMVGPSGAPTRIREGARAEIDRLVGTNVNDLHTLERKLGTPQDWNHQKLGAIFGDEPRDRVVQALMENRQFRDSYQKIVQNSQTAQRTSSAQAMEGSAGGNVPTDTTLTGLGLKAVNLVAKVLSGASSANTKDEIGRILASQGPEAQRIAQALLASAQRASASSESLRRVLSSPELIGATTPGASRK
jgi:hypothetical protein